MIFKEYTGTCSDSGDDLVVCSYCLCTLTGLLRILGVSNAKQLSSEERCPLVAI